MDGIAIFSFSAFSSVPGLCLGPGATDVIMGCCVMMSSSCIMKDFRIHRKNVLRPQFSSNTGDTATWTPSIITNLEVFALEKNSLLAIILIIAWSTKVLYMKKNNCSFLVVTFEDAFFSLSLLSVLLVTALR